MPKRKTSGTARRTYRIQIEGFLNPSWSDRLGGLSITAVRDSDIKTSTVLEGELADQSALMGVLNSLHELHLPVEVVERLSPRHAG